MTELDMNGETLGQGLRSTGSTVVCLLCGQAWPITHLEDHSPGCVVPELQRLRLHVQATKRVIEAARALAEWESHSSERAEYSMFNDADEVAWDKHVDEVCAAIRALDAAPEPKE